MPLVEVYGDDETTLIFSGEFNFLPRVGEYISKDAGGFFEYFIVKEVWHREMGGKRSFQACLRVAIDD